MNRNQIMKNYGHLSVEQLPDDVQDVVQQDPELQAFFADGAWLQGLLELKRLEHPPSAAESRIQHRVETRIHNASSEDLQALAGERRWYSFLTGRDTGAAPRSPFATFATPVTLAAGMAIGLYAAHLMVAEPPTPSGTGPEGLVVQPTAPEGHTGEMLPVSHPATVGSTPATSESNGFERAVFRP